MMKRKTKIFWQRVAIFVIIAAFIFGGLFSAVLSFFTGTIN